MAVLATYGLCGTAILPCLATQKVLFFVFFACRQGIPDAAGGCYLFCADDPLAMTRGQSRG